MIRLIFERKGGLLLRERFTDERMLLTSLQGYTSAGFAKKKLYSYKSDFLKALPDFVTRNFPFLFTYRAGIHLDVFQDLLSLMETSTGIAGFRKMLREKYMLRYDFFRLSFLSCLQHLRYKKPNNGQLLFNEKKWQMLRYRKYWMMGIFQNSRKRIYM